MYTELEYQLFKKRFHGKSNLMGIDFQIHVSLNNSLNLLSTQNQLEKVTLEGIEDIDLRHSFQTDNTYVQVKTSINSWHLPALAKPIINFISLNKTTQNSNKFSLIFNFEPRLAIQNLFSKEITIADKENLIKELLKQKDIKENSVSREELIDVITNCEVRYFNKENLIADTKLKIINLFDIHPNEVDNFLLSLLYKFIDWSIERKTIIQSDLTDFNIKFKENKERSLEFEAFGKGLIDRISWTKETHSIDYFEGKKTRSGHIALGLDVKRPKWLKKVDEVFAKTNVCIIREASGQGKSTLAFRYAHDYWNPDTTFIIKVVETAEQAEQISNYLKMLAELGLIISVIIDDINSDRKYFSSVLQNCANHQIHFLITSRNDDYHSFGSIGQISLEFVIPYFNRDEAKHIFQNLKRENRIHKEVISSDWAFERISSPKCLIEFIFLITQGEMLLERLSQQIREMRLNNQYSKIDFLRKVILADVCQVPLNINAILLNDNSNIDYQEIIQSTKNEFISIESDYIKGYHWVRSFHLLKILHEDYTNPAITALKTISLIERDKLSIFIGNLTEVPEFDVDILIENYKLISNKADLKIYISFVAGIFKIGEYLFFLSNREIYDEAYIKFNEGVLFLFNSKFLPTISIDVFEILGKNGNFEEARELSKKFKTEVRGFNWAKAFIETNKLTYELNDENLNLAGDILDWSYWLNIHLFDSSSIDKLILNSNIINLPINDFSLFSQSLFRIYPDKHSQWFKSNQSAILKKLEIDLKCSISLKNNIVTITYTGLEKDESYNEATVKRLSIIRSAIPFCVRYKGHHTLLTIFSSLRYKYGHDESNKDIPAENLHFGSDTEKNKIINEIVESHYRVKTWYEFDYYYYQLRCELISYGESLCRRLEGSSKDLGKIDAVYISERILHSYKKLPVEIDPLKTPFADCRDTFNSFSAFLLMKSNFIQNEFDEDSKKFIFLNYNNFLIQIPRMQHFFDAIKEFSPHYFKFEELNLKEGKVFSYLKELLKVNIPNSKSYWDLHNITD